MEVSQDRKRKSVPLTKEEVSAFRKHLKTFHTKTDAQIAYGVSRSTLDRVAIIGSGSEEAIAAIRAKLAELNQAA